MSKVLSVDELLDQVDYALMNDGNYAPSKFAIKFVNMVKLINGGQGEENLTPVMHYKMLDNITGKTKRTANLCFRGSSKTTLFGQYLFFYICLFGGIDGFGDIPSILYISDSIENGVKTLRNGIETRYNNSEFLMKYLPKTRFTENYIEVMNISGKKTGMKLFGAKSGLRGTQIFGKRPVLAILDDLVSDDDAESDVSMSKISNTIYSGLINALHPDKNKIIWNGTPFNKNDVLYKAVESGGWSVNVYPVCERFPCTKEEFKGAWEDRFSYEHVKELYNFFDKNKRLNSFYQELMLNITSTEERLVQDSEIHWYQRESLLKHKYNFNFYITTDFATSEKQKSDYSVISVWAVNNTGDYFWVDGICKRQTMDKTIQDLFKLVQVYKPQSVGIEITGQQGAFLSWINEKMISENIYFTLARQKGTANVGIRPTTNKLSRFNLIVPMFSKGKILFPTELKDTAIVSEFINEIRMATYSGLKGKDDCIDTISMLSFMDIIIPNTETITQKEESIWSIHSYFKEDDSNFLQSYTVD